MARFIYGKRCLVFGDARVHFIRPGENAAFEIVNFAESGFPQKIDSLGGTLAAPAVRDNFLRRIEFVHAARQFAKRQQVSFDIADLIFVRFAHIENVEIIAAIEACFQFARKHFRNLQIRCRSFFSTHAAEFVVINQLVDGAIFSAHRAIGILAQLQFTELHAERIEEQQTAGKAITCAKNQFDGFHRLNGTNDSGQHAEHAAFSARRNQAWRRRLRIQAAVAGAIRHTENGGLPFEPEDLTVDVRLTEQDACIIHEVTSGEIIGTVDDNVKVLEKFERIGAGKLGFKAQDFDVGIKV